MEENYKGSDGRISDQNYKNFRRDRGYIFLKESQDDYYYADNVGSIHIIPKNKLFLIMNLDLQDEIIHEYGLERRL
jgi:uncharacterized protein YdeI (BOF family)